MSPRGETEDTLTRAQSKSNVKRETLLKRIGGDEALRAAVDIFYGRLLKEEQLQPFFEGVNVKLLKWHQYNFMSIAFTQVPDDFDVGALIMEKHERLFDMGLNEVHFDLVAGHFVATLQSLDVPKDLIDEAVSIVGPLRDVFILGAEKATEKKKLTRRRNIAACGAVVAALVGVVIYNQN